jgi:hypothetical protein
MRNLAIRLEGGGRQTWAKEGNEQLFFQPSSSDRGGIVCSKVMDIDWKRWWGSLCISFLF